MSLLNIGTGTYYGDGTYGSNVTGTSSTGYTRATSSVNFRTMSNNIASGYSADMEIIQKYFEEGKTDKAIEKYESLFDDIKTTTGNYRYSLTDSEIESILNTSYQNITGSTIVDSIENNTCGSFLTGLKQSIPIFGLFCNDVSEAEALAKVAGDEVSFKDRALELAGMAVGTLAFWGLGGWILSGAANTTGTVANILSKIGITKQATDAAKAAGAAKTAADAVTTVTSGAKLASGAMGVAVGATQTMGFLKTSGILES